MDLPPPKIEDVPEEVLASWDVFIRKQKEKLQKQYDAKWYKRGKQRRSDPREVIGRTTEPPRPVQPRIKKPMRHNDRVNGFFVAMLANASIQKTQGVECRSD